MAEYKNLGKVTKKYVSGMAQTDQGEKFPAGADVDKGDYLITENGRKMFVSAEEFKEINKVIKAQERSSTTQTPADADATTGGE